MTMVWSSEYGAVDGDFADVSLLLKGEGTNGSTTIVDSSSNNLSVTANNGAQISTAQSKFGLSSIEFLSSANTGLSVSPNTDFQFGTGDWTVEAWIYQRSLSIYSTLFEVGNHLNNDSFLIATGSYNATGLLVYSNAYFNAPSRGTITTNQWQFVTVSRKGNFLYFSVDGTVDTPVAFINDLTSTATVSVGYAYGFVPSANNNDYRFDGYISNLRITKGVARYTENFDVPTAPFPILSPSGRITIADDSLDADARQYIINVEEQDGEELEAGVRTAINNFVVGCKSDGIWNAIKESCLLSGARTVEGALVPLKGSAPTNNGPFVAADYDRKTGLLGNGSSKYLTTAALISTLERDNSHAAINCRAFGNKSFLGNPSVARFDWYEVTGVPTLRHLYGGGGGGTLPTSISSTGFIGTVRDTFATTYVARANGINYNITSGSPGIGPAEPLWIFRSPSAGYSTDRIAFYSIGESLDLALLDTRISNFITAIGAAI